MKMPRVQVYQAVDAPPSHQWMVCVGLATGNCWSWVNCFGSTEEIARSKAKVILDEWKAKMFARDARAKKAALGKMKVV